MVLVYLVFFAGGRSWAQSAAGRVIGTVLDQQGGAVPGAKVTATNTQTGVDRTTSTDKDGFFQILELPIGSYHISVERDGFAKAVTQDKKLEINQSLRFDITLNVGTTSQTITIEAKVSGVETVNPTLGQTITGAQIQDTPLNGRDVLDLALLQPGVAETNPSDSGNTGAGKFNIAGGRSDSVNFVLDGGLNNNLISNGRVFDPNPDTIEEFRLLTSDYTAEYGRNGGGIITEVTKSGTNVIHGSAFDYIRNTDFNANSYFNILDDVERGDLKRHQFGGTVGGPLTIPHVVNGKDRFFWFLGYQGQRQTQTTVEPNVTTFTTAELGGDFSQAVQTMPSPGMPTMFMPDPNVAAFLQANPFFQSNKSLAAMAIIDPTKINPIATNYIALGLIPATSSGLVTSTGRSTDDNNEITGKVDFNVSSKDKLSATIGGIRGAQLFPFPFTNGAFGANVPGFPTTFKTNDYFSNIAYVRTFSPNLLNELRFTAQREYTLSNAPSTTLPIPATLGFGITPDHPDGPPLLNFDTGLNVGYNGQGPAALFNNTFALSDVVTWVKGRNTWKFGAGISAYQNNQVFDFFGDGDFSYNGAASGGIGSGNSFADFLLGLPNNYFQGANAHSNIRSKTTYGFFQDEWRLRSNLTLTMGLRYEYSTPKSDTDGRTFDIFPGRQSTRFVNAPLGLLYPGDKGAPTGVNFPVRNNWAPRFGFAWDPWNDGKTSIRGGAGIFYDILKAEDNFQFNGTPPFYSIATLFYPALAPNSSGPVPFYSDPFGSAGSVNPFPSTPPTANIDFANAGFLPLGVNGIFLVNPHLHTPYTYQYNLSIQREVAPSIVAEVSYVGSSAKGLTANVDINPFILGGTGRVLNQNQTNSNLLAFCQSFAAAQGLADPTATCPYANLPAFENIGFESYNSLEASLTKRESSNRFFGKSYFTLAYTYGRAIDNTSGFQNRTFQVPAYNIGQFRGPADFNTQHRITFSGAWDLPFDKAWASGPKLLTTGWKILPILTWRTGFPLSINGQLPLNSADPGPSGAGDGPLASALFAPGVNHINIAGPTNPAGTAPSGFPTCSVTPQNTGCVYYFNANDFVSGASNATYAAAAPQFQKYGIPRNFFYGPGSTNLNLALAKSFNVFENLKAQLRLEAFNVFNHAEFSNPDTNLADMTAGQILKTADPRIVQIAIRLDF
jgi:hypothetical protein